MLRREEADDIDHEVESKDNETSFATDPSTDEEILSSQKDSFQEDSSDEDEEKGEENEKFSDSESDSNLLTVTSLSLSASRNGHQISDDRVDE